MAEISIVGLISALWGGRGGSLSQPFVWTKTGSSRTLVNAGGSGVEAPLVWSEMDSLTPRDSDTCRVSTIASTGSLKCYQLARSPLSMGSFPGGNVKWFQVMWETFHPACQINEILTKDVFLLIFKVFQSISGMWTLYSSLLRSLSAVTLISSWCIFFNYMFQCYNIFSLGPKESVLYPHVGQGWREINIRTIINLSFYLTAKEIDVK